LRDAPGAPRWSAPHRWHLTLLFLGAVPEERVPPLIDAAGTAVAGAGPMILRLAGGGRFGSLRRPQVAWAGLDGDVAPLSELTDRLAGYRGPAWPVTEVRLWESRLGPKPTYETVAAWPIAR
jgi:2'-5' RNA ligase